VSLNVTAITVEMWAKLSALKDWAVFAARGNWGIERSWLFGQSSSSVLYSKVLTTGGSALTPWGFTPTTGEWYHFVFTYDATNGMKTYVNSVAKATAPANGDINNTEANQLCIGTQSDYSNIFDGLIDEPRISDVARSAAWIKANYHSMTDHLVTWGEEEVLL